MEEITFKPFAIIVEGNTMPGVTDPKSPMVTNPSAEAVANGVEKGLYYRVTFVGERVLDPLTGKKRNVGAGSGKERSYAIFQQTNATYFRAIEEMLQSGECKELDRTIMKDGKVEKTKAFELSDYTIYGMWIEEAVEPYYVVDYSKGKAEPRQTVVKQLSTGKYLKEKMTSEIITYFLFEDESQIAKMKRAKKQIEYGQQLYLADHAAKKAKDAKIEVTPEMIDLEEKK